MADIMEYAVFSRRLLTGTISDLPPFARIAWITILFEAERLRGKVKIPVRDLAKMASITTAEAADALSMLLAPDEFSSSKEHDGRRLLPVEGEEDWYSVVTWDKHVEERGVFFARLRKQRQRAGGNVTAGHGESRSVTNEPEQEPEPKQENKRFNVSSAFEAAWMEYPKRVGKVAAERHFRATVKTETDLGNLCLALDRYKASKRVREGFIQDGSRWFKDWRDWVDGAESVPAATEPEAQDTRPRLERIHAARIPIYKLLDQIGDPENDMQARAQFNKFATQITPDESGDRWHRWKAACEEAGFEPTDNPKGGANV